MSENQATEGETVSNARRNLPNGYSAELKILTRETESREKILNLCCLKRE